MIMGIYALIFNVDLVTNFVRIYACDPLTVDLKQKCKAEICSCYYENPYEVICGVHKKKIYP